MVASLLARSGLYNDPVLPDYVDASNITSVALYYTNHAVPQRFNPGIIVASIAVAALGSYSTLLLLGRRTSHKGARNVFLLFFAATTMSCVGIWGMHFIGMHMSLAPTKDVQWYIAFNPGFTVFSLFVPTIALALVFYILDQDSKFSLVRTTISGILTGCIVSLMHYSASFLSNFRVSYGPGQTIASIILACLASTIALATFFRFKAQWEDSWWKRLLCALILACGVSGMHYTGVWGTSYTVKMSSLGNEAQLMQGNRKNNVVVIAIAIMCFLIVVISTFLAVTDILLARETRRNARKVVIASATFDRSGRMLVKADGSMPMIVIETQLRMTEVMDALDKRQSTFQWLYTVSWDWDMVVPFLKAITARFFQLAQKEEAAAKTEGKAAGMLGRRVSLESTQDRGHRGPQALADFRDRVIDAAGQLAQELDIPLQHVGILYDSVLPTGTRKARAAANALAAARQATPQTMPGYPGRTRSDDENSINMPAASIFGEGDDEQEGVTLFLVRELPSTSAAVDAVERYRQRGYRMTEPRFLGSVLADRFAVIKEDMDALLDSLKVYAKRGTRPVVQPGGVYAGLFGVRASTSKQGGLDVLVYNFARHQIPAYRLPDVQYISPDMKTFLRMLDQMPMDEAMRTCERESIRSSDRKKRLQLQASELSVDTVALNEEEQVIDAMIRFQTALFIALDALLNSVRFYPRLASTARLSAEVLEVPSSLDDSTSPAEMILVQAVLPEEHALLATQTQAPGFSGPVAALPTDVPNSATPFVFTPYTLFAKSQMMLLRGRQADDFEHEVVLELRRRYPSSLMQEAEEKGSASPVRKYSVSSDHDSIGSSGSPYKDEKALDDIVGVQRNNSVALQALPTLRKLTSKLTTGGIEGRQGSRDGGSPFNHQQQQGPRRTSNASARRGDGNANAMSEYDTPLQVVSVQENRNGSPTSPSGTTFSGTTAFDMSSPARQIEMPLHPAAAAAQDRPSTAGSSLGIRRFIADGGAQQQQHGVNGGRFARPAEDNVDGAMDNADGDEEYEEESERITTSSGDVSLGRAFEYPMLSSGGAGGMSIPLPPIPSSPPATRSSRVPPRRGSKTTSHPLSSRDRPSTAPASRDAMRLQTGSRRPRTAEQSQTPVLSQRHAARSMHNEASVLARLRADDWSARQLQALERGPSSTALLGVDF